MSVFLKLILFIYYMKWSRKRGDTWYTCMQVIQFFKFGDSAVSKEILLGDHVYYILQARNNFLFKC